MTRERHAATKTHHATQTVQLELLARRDPAQARDRVIESLFGLPTIVVVVGFVDAIRATASTFARLLRWLVVTTAITITINSVVDNIDVVVVVGA